VLYTFEVGGVVKLAVVTHRGTGVDGSTGWYVESWASCDLAELPDWVAARAGYQIWSDREGRVATTRVVSYAGSEHCDWQDATILQLGNRTWWRNPPDELGQYFDQSYAEGMHLPADAVATPYSREGERLWLSPDKLAAYVGTRRDVERWVSPGRRLGCA
jgi:hypothetical protein